MVGEIDGDLVVGFSVGEIDGDSVVGFLVGLDVGVRGTVGESLAHIVGS